MKLQLPNGRHLTVHALIDSGASADFFDIDLALEQRLALIPLDFPLQVQTIDGRPLVAGDVAYQTPPMRMDVDRHTETLSFHVTKLSGHPVVLGMSWLAKHDPAVAWHQRSLTFASAHCLQNCLGRRREDSLGVQGAKVGEEGVHTGEVNIPHYYAAYKDVFSEKEADKLPPPTGSMIAR